MTSKEKTVRQWYEELPPDVRDKAIANTCAEELDLPEVSLDKALLRSFIFEKTPEGDDFWWKYVKKYDEEDDD